MGAANPASGIGGGSGSADGSGALGAWGTSSSDPSPDRLGSGGQSKLIHLMWYLAEPPSRVPNLRRAPGSGQVGDGYRPPSRAAAQCRAPPPWRASGATSTTRLDVPHLPPCDPVWRCGGSQRGWVVAAACRPASDPCHQRHTATPRPADTRPTSLWHVAVLWSSPRPAGPPASCVPTARSWHGRTNIWRKATNPALAAKRLRGGTTARRYGSPGQAFAVFGKPH
jgi:hypothetical protein